MSFDDLFFAIIIAGTGLTVAYLRAEYVLHRKLKTAEHKKLIVQRELLANRLGPRQIDAPVAAIRNHQDFLSKELAICAQDKSPSTVYSRKSVSELGIARHRELA